MLARNGDVRLHVRDFLQATSRHRAEAQRFAQADQRRAVGLAAVESRPATSGASSAIVVSWRQSSACSLVRAEFHRDLRRAAHAQVRHFVHAREQRVEAAEMREQDRRRLRRPRPARRECCRPRRRSARGSRRSGALRTPCRAFTPAIAPAPFCGVVPLLVQCRQQLRQVLVGGHDHAADGRWRARHAARCRSGRRLRSRACASTARPSARHSALQCANWRLSSSGAGSRLAL